MSSTGIDLKSEIRNPKLQIYPNPYTGETQIKFSLSEKAKVNLKVYNLLGKKVATLENNIKSAGIHHYHFSAKNSGYAAGVYILKLQVNDQQYTSRLLEY